MSNQKKYKLYLVGAFLLLFSWIPLPIVEALGTPQYTSTNYGVNEVFIGSGGVVNGSSTNYSINASIGGATSGVNAYSTNYQVFSGFNTTDAPYLQFIVNSSNVDLGVLSSSSTATTTGTFSIRAWNSGGYTVLNASPPPSAGGEHTLNPLTSATTSSPGSEQFGINLVANTSPAIGANPVESPNSSFAFGQAATGYNTPNYFKYNDGDVIAYSNSSSSITVYTVSYIFNISPYTPAGVYTFNHIMVALPTY